MILGELKGVVSPESWTSECSEGKSLETSDRFRPASESSVLSSDMAGQARELGVSVEVRGLSAQRGGAPEREHESGPVSSMLAADRQRSLARAAEDGPRGAGGRDKTGNPACVLAEGGVRQRKGFAVAASTLLAVVRPSEGRPPRRLSCPRPAREGGGGPRPRSHARRRPTGSRSSGAGTTALAWGRAVVDLPTSIPSSRA
jgi:hypothetical protein